MKEQLDAIKKRCLLQIDTAKDLSQLENLRIAIFGKKGELTAILRSMGAVKPEDRPIMGQLVNDIRAQLEDEFNQKLKQISKAAQDQKLKSQSLDITLPGKRKVLGCKHPMTIVIEDICKIFMGMGFEVAEGPDIETQYYNFEALNIYEGHTARDEQDTFYLDGGMVLRTHTSPVQIRHMQSNTPPIAIIAPGKVFRSDQVDATHTPVFHQLEGLMVDKGIHMGHLKGALTVFAKSLFGNDVVTRFRPHHFAFTEPSAEMDISCFGCGGKGCNICKGEGFIELMGCGMVHPDVLARCDIDPNIYSGFAFGMGLERIAMKHYNIPDLRLLFENDMQFLKQF